MQDASQPQTIDGVFTPRLVARLHRDGFDGTLRFNADGSTRVIYFRRGEIASAASNAEDDRLHNILIRDGRLTPPQLEMARARQQPGASLGKTLIELGFLTPAELLQGARRQVRQVLTACFGLTGGTYQVHPGPLPAAVTALGLPARRMIFDALLESGDRQAVVREMGSMESIYRPTDATVAAVASMRLDPPMEKVASLLDGRMTLRDISGRMALDDFTVSKVVLGLEILGLAEMRSPQPEVEVAVAPPVAVAVAAPPEPEADEMAEEVDDEGVAAEAVVALPAAARAGAQGRRIPIEIEPAAPQVHGAPNDDGRDEAGWERPGEPASPPAGPTGFEPEGKGRATMPVAEVVAAPLPERGSDPDEMPPFPRDELPAFAVPPEEPRVGWQVDPETGERVHSGPIELTFDGTMAPPPESRSLTSHVTAVAVVAGVVIAAALLAAYFRRGPEGVPAGGEGTPIETAAVEPPPGPASADSGGTPSRPPAAEPVEPRVPAAEPQPESRPAAEPEPDREQAPPAPPPETAAPARPAADRAASRQETERQGVPGGPRFTNAQRIIDAGRIDVAAAAFRGLVIEEGPDPLTLQLLIACDPETIRHARAATAPDSPLFVVPFAMQGRSCYRACWGMYRAKADARAAAATLPPYFTSAGVTPVVVSFGRLVPPS